MNLLIEIVGNDSRTNQKQLNHLKQFLERANIEELQELKVDRTEAKEGEMGGGILKGLSTVLIGGEGPLTKLAEALVKYVEILRSDIKLKNRAGEELHITAKMNKKSINELVDKFYAESRKKNAEEKTDEHPIAEKEAPKKLEEPEDLAKQKEKTTKAKKEPSDELEK